MSFLVSGLGVALNHIPLKLDVWLRHVSKLGTSNLRFASVVDLLFLIKGIHLIGVWFIEDQRTNVVKTHVWPHLWTYIEHYLQPASPCILEFLRSRCPTLFDETCGSLHKAWKNWCVSWAMIWSRYIEGKPSSQDSLQHIDVEKCALRRVV